MENKTAKNITLSAMFIAMGCLLPFLTGQIPEIGKALLPMHIPVFLSGFICGWQYGFATGFITLLLRSLVFGMPLLFPVSAAMALELAAYGAISGLVYMSFRKQNIMAIYVSMLMAMVAGRIVWGIAETVFLGLSGKSFGWSLFIGGAVIDAVPGILIQLLLIPIILVALDKTGVVRFKRKQLISRS